MKRFQEKRHNQEEISLQFVTPCHRYLEIHFPWTDRSTAEILARCQPLSKHLIEPGIINLHLYFPEGISLLSKGLAKMSPERQYQCTVEPIKDRND